MLITFKIRGNLRFLSHAEMLRVFQRACVRAGVKVQYSQGFNPRPKLSLPLPKSVGVESDCDLLSLSVAGSKSLFDKTQFETALGRQLPEGCQLLSINVTTKKTSPQPKLAAYLMSIQPKYLHEKLKARIDWVLASKNLYIRRRTKTKGSTRNVNIRGFFKSIKLHDGNITVECNIGPKGSIRIDEILKSLELDAQKLSAPIRRTNVQWN